MKPNSLLQLRNVENLPRDIVKSCVLGAGASLVEGTKLTCFLANLSVTDH